MHSNIINLNAKHKKARRTSDGVFAGRMSTEGVLAPPETDLPALTDHPFPGPFLTASWNEVRCRALQRQVLQLETELGSDHPQIALVRSWYAVSHGAECLGEDLLKMLREAEPVIRVHYPEAHWALAMNLAAQGCHVRALRKRDEATGSLASAFHLMMLHDVAVAADIVKVAELLADCYSACGAFDDALFILYTAQQFIPGAVEQSELIASQCEEFRERFIAEQGHMCSQQYQGELDQLADLRADILVTHEAPGYHRHGWAILDTLAQSMGVKVSVHGHHHDRLDSSQHWEQQGFKSIGVGLRGLTVIDGEGNATVIVAGELDEQRNHRQRYLDAWKDIS